MIWRNQSLMLARLKKEMSAVRLYFMKFDADSSETSCIVWVCEHSSWFFDGNATMFFLHLHKTCQRRTHYSLISSCIVPKHLIRNVNKKNVDRKKSCLARHPSSTFDVIQASRSSPIIGAVVQNYFWGFTNITLSKIDSVEVKFLSQAPEFLKNHLILSGNAMFAPFLLGMPRKITKITAMFDPGRIPKWQRKWSRVLHPEMMISTLPLN